MSSFQFPLSGSRTVSPRRCPRCQFKFFQFPLSGSPRGRIFPRRSRRRRALLSIPSLGITCRRFLGVVRRRAAELSIPSLGITLIFQQTLLWERRTSFNSLSRDHSMKTFTLTPRWLRTFNSLSRDHCAYSPPELLRRGRHLSIPSLGITPSHIRRRE